MQVKSELRSFLSRQSGLQLADTEALWEGGAIDSLGLLKLVRFIEDSFGVRIDSKDISLTTFHSIDTIASYIERKMKNG